MSSSSLFSAKDNGNDDNSKSEPKQKEEEEEEEEVKLYYQCVVVVVNTSSTKEEETVVKIGRINDNDDNSTTTTTTKPAPSTLPPQEPLPESVLQYQRQLRKVQASNRATNTSLAPSQHLHVLYHDEYIVVADKPSGVLCVPGVRNNPSLLSLVYRAFPFQHVTEEEKEEEEKEEKEMKRSAKRFQKRNKKRKRNKVVTMDSMIVHRLDMDTSGIVVFGRNEKVVKVLHEAFRERKVTKKYEALLCGHLPLHINQGEISMPLQRDHRHPPFMRVSTPKSEKEALNVVKDLQHAGWKKIIMKKPKDSVTHFRVLKREETEFGGGGGGGGGKRFPTTRVELVPVTGRTHQLRVHCAAIGHPIVADPAYGIWGEASPNGGFGEREMDEMFPHRARLDLQRDIDDAVRHHSSTDNINAKEDTKNDDDENDNTDSDFMCMCLHARELGFDHPITGERMVFEAPPAF